MKGDFNNIKISGIASAVPKYVDDNYNYIPILGERKVKKQVKLTGIRKRHMSKKYQRASDLCYVAANQVLDNLKWNRKEVAVLIFVTQSSNFLIPSTAIELQDRLGIGKNCIAYDINLGCSGYDYGVLTVASLLQSFGEGAKGICLIGDIAYAPCSEDGLRTEALVPSMMFGTAGSAVAIEIVKESSVKFMNMCDGSGYDAIINRGGVYGNTEMKGNAVFEFAINEVSESVMEFKKYHNIPDEEVDYYVFHQAQKLILDNIQNTCLLREDQVLSSLEKYGNTSGASIPLTICANRALLQKKDRIKMITCGYGVGLSWALTYLELDTKGILPVVETDEYYKEDMKPNGILKNHCVFLIGADTEIGNLITRYLDGEGVQIVLCGKNKEELEELKGQLFWESNDLVYEIQESNILSVFDDCNDKNIKVNGIIFADQDISENLVEKMSGAFIEAKYTQDFSSIILLCNLEEYNLQGNTERYQFKNKELTDYMERILDEGRNKKIRVNEIVYAEESFDMYPRIGDSIDWAKEYLRKDKPDSMVKPYGLCSAIRMLLMEESKYITKAVVTIDGV